MNTLDSIYFAAIADASSGVISQPALAALHKQALKFRTLEMGEEAARFYERLFQIWRTVDATGATDALRGSTAFFKGIFCEYLSVLHDLRRTERSKDIEAAIARLSTMPRQG